MKALLAALFATFILVEGGSVIELEDLAGDCTLQNAGGSLSSDCDIAVKGRLLTADASCSDLRTDVAVLKNQLALLLSHFGLAQPPSMPPSSPPPPAPPPPSPLPAPPPPVVTPPAPMQGVSYRVGEYYWPTSGSIWSTEVDVKGWNLMGSDNFMILQDTEERAYADLQWYYTYWSPRGCNVIIQGRNGGPGDGYCKTQTTTPCREDAGPGGSSDSLWEPVARGEMFGETQGIKTLRNQVIDPTYNGKKFSNWRVIWNGVTTGHCPLSGWTRIISP